MTHRSFAEAVLSADSLCHDSFDIEITFAERCRAQLVDLFRAPYDRGYAGQYWGGMRPPRSDRARQMFRLDEKDGEHRFSYDDVVYHVPTRVDTREVAGKPFSVTTRLGWRRLTPKVERPGHARRARLRMEREAA